MLESMLLTVAMVASDPAALLEEATGGGARVTLEGQRGALDLSGARPRLVFSVLAHSTLAVPVAAVEVGVLFAATEQALQRADASALYNAGVGSTTVGVLRQRVAVALPPGGRAAVEVGVELRPGQPDPLAFRTHVLGYRLAQVTAAVLLELLGTRAGADEVAAVETLAVTGTAAEKRAVRERWGADRELVATLAATVREPLPAQPNVDAVLRLVYVVRALGVLGGDTAGATLRALLADPSLAGLDEALLMLLTARVVGSPLETPIAFAVPPTARHFSEVVATALADVTEPMDTVAASDDGAAAPVPAAADASDAIPAAAVPGQPGVAATPTVALPHPWLAAAVLGVASLAALLWWRLRRRRSS